MPSEPSSVTVIKDCAGRYFLSFVVEIEPIEVEPENQGVGVDLGLETLATKIRRSAPPIPQSG
ncbi:Transposase [Geitlerinema sp. FC II]|nr:Transposase [Geitlerinema sp. FC II]